MITAAKFYGNRLRGFGVTGPLQTPFPILNVHRPYNSVSTTVLHCDHNCAITYNGTIPVQEAQLSLGKTDRTVYI